MSTPTPDYGEPWRKEIMGGIVGKTDDFMVLPYMDYEGLDWDSETLRDRAITCVNALAGVQDPAAHLANLNATIEQQSETLKVMNDALKEAHRIFGNLSHSQVVQRLCPDFAEVAEIVRKSHDQHA